MNNVHHSDKWGKFERLPFVLAVSFQTRSFLREAARAQSTPNFSDLENCRVVYITASTLGDLTAILQFIARQDPELKLEVKVLPKVPVEPKEKMIEEDGWVKMTVPITIGFGNHYQRVTIGVEIAQLGNTWFCLEQYHQGINWKRNVVETKCTATIPFANLGDLAARARGGQNETAKRLHEFLKGVCERTRELARARKVEVESAARAAEAKRQQEEAEKQTAEAERLQEAWANRAGTTYSLKSFTPKKQAYTVETGQLDLRSVQHA